MDTNMITGVDMWGIGTVSDVAVEKLRSVLPKSSLRELRYVARPSARHLLATCDPLSQLAVSPLPDAAPARCPVCAQPLRQPRV